MRRRSVPERAAGLEERGAAPLVRLRPRDHTLYASRGRTVLATERDGFIDDGAEHGLLVHQTRLLSRYRYRINNRLPQPNALSNVEQHTWLGYYVIAPSEDDGDSGERTIELRLSRRLGDGLHEDVDLTNFTGNRAEFRLSLELDADFADQEETKGERNQKGAITREWRAAGTAWELVFDYTAEHRYDHPGETGRARLHRGLTFRVENASSAPEYREERDGHVRLDFDIGLDPLASWHACMNAIPLIDGVVLGPIQGCRALTGMHDERDRLRRIFLNEATGFATPESGTLSHVVTGALERAKTDLIDMRLHDLDRDEREWVMAAGLPIYVALFGRDSLTAAWQGALAGTEMMRGVLAELPRWQGKVVNDWRDEQPGRMLHQADTGPLAVLNFNPRSRYYGSVTTSGFYPVVLGELWHWTGDRERIRPLVEPALAGIRWLDEYARAGGNGFYRYRTRSEQGLENQGWKDSGSAIVYEDGTQVEAPVATCEEQAFVHLAKLFLSELLFWLDEKEEARRLYREAIELKERFNEAFWLEDERYLAMGLDPEGRPIRAIGSNAGHCLAAGIVDDRLVPLVADRLMAEDLFSGWGIRTLSSGNPAYNPYSYHRGSVWPVEQGTFALAFMRYGFLEHLHRLTEGMFEATALFEHYRLPELFSGHPRDDEHPFPANYPRANSPQAWSASAVFCFLQALLGLYPYAPLNLLVVDPHLPDWLPQITLTRLRIGQAVVTLRFYRKPDGTSDYEVLDLRGRLHVLRQPSPWSFTATYGERLKDALTSLLPGK